MESFGSQVLKTLNTKLLHLASDESSEMAIRRELAEVEAKLKELLLRTVLDGENASVILYGYSGTGKSLVLERTLRSVEGDWDGDVSLLCVIRLSGLLERDKRDGFKSIARQLCSFMNVKFISHISADRNIKFLKEALKKLYEANRICVFVLDAFEKFVGDSEKQEIVYTLLDVLQLKEVRACVIGMTTDFRVKTDFDKRVHSRFSHKSWIVPHEVPLVLESMLEMPVVKKEKKKVEKYNRSIQESIADPTVQELLKRGNGLFSARDVQGLAVLSVASAMSREQKAFKITPEDLQYAIQQCMDRYDSFPVKIAQLAVPHLYMLVSCSHLEPGFTYKAALAKYDCFIRTQNTSDVFDAPILTQAFEDLFHERFIIRTKETK